MKVIAAKISIPIVSFLDYLVEKGVFTSRSEAIRHILSFFMSKMGNNITVDINKLSTNRDRQINLTVKIPDFIREMLEQFRQLYGFTTISETVRYILVSKILDQYINNINDENKINNENKE